MLRASTAAAVLACEIMPSAKYVSVWRANSLAATCSDVENCVESISCHGDIALTLDSDAHPRPRSMRSSRYRGKCSQCRRPCSHRSERRPCACRLLGSHRFRLLCRRSHTCPRSERRARLAAPRQGEPAPDMPRSLCDLSTAASSKLRGPNHTQLTGGPARVRIGSSQLARLAPEDVEAGRDDDGRRRTSMIASGTSPNTT